MILSMKEWKFVYGTIVNFNAILHNIKTSYDSQQVSVFIFQAKNKKRNKTNVLFNNQHFMNVLHGCWHILNDKTTEQ